MNIISNAIRLICGISVRRSYVTSCEMEKNLFLRKVTFKRVTSALNKKNWNLLKIYSETLCQRLSLLKFQQILNNFLNLNIIRRVES